jgi:hypothetical protein
MKAEQRRKVRDLVDQVMLPFEQNLEKIRKKINSLVGSSSRVKVIHGNSRRQTG